LACLLPSTIFTLLAVIKGIRSIKRKEKGFIYNLIAVIGSTTIIVLWVYWVFELYTIYRAFN
jgi:hypothetical protein